MRSFGQIKDYFASRKKKVPFRMAMGTGELMQECLPKHSRMGTARMKKYKETNEEGKERGVSMERRKRLRRK